MLLHTIYISDSATGAGVQVVRKNMADSDNHY